MPVPDIVSSTTLSGGLGDAEGEESEEGDEGDEPGMGTGKGGGTLR